MQTAHELIHQHMTSSLPDCLQEVKALETELQGKVSRHVNVSDSSLNVRVFVTIHKVCKFVVLVLLSYIFNKHSHKVALGAE